MSDELCINTLRTLCPDMVQKANSGHPGAPMGMAPMAYVLWTKFLRHNPHNPKWFNRDRFVLSNGHACALLYALLHLTGYSEFPMDELKRFRQLGSKAAGHPENHLVNGGIEVSTGPLGQGLSNAVGMAICSAHLAAKFNKPNFNIIDNYIYAFCGDGCLNEGITSEASSLAGHLGLGRLIVFYDDNSITIDGDTDLAFTEDVLKRYESYGWHTQTVEHGNDDLKAIEEAVIRAKQVTDRPHIIKVKTLIGFGSAKAPHGVHGAPLGPEDLANVKKKFGFDPTKSFHVPDEAYAVYGQAKAKGQALEQEWNQLFDKYAAVYPDLAGELKRRISGQLPADWKKALPVYKPEDPAKATRQFGQTVINSLAKVLPELIGGSADLNPSTLTYMDCDKDFQKATPEGRNIRFGIREHAMAAICNGIAAYGGFIPYCSTFLNFLGYCWGAALVSAVSHFGVIYIMTHDSIGLGEDGPTHQPISHLMMIRATPDMILIRPADGNETSGAYLAAIESRHHPVVISLTRQAVPNLKGSSIEGTLHGAYVLTDAEGGKPEAILVGSGSETSLCVSAAAQLKDVKVRVVSMPSWELFKKQSVEYQLSVFPEGVPVVAVEAAASLGWAEYAHAVVGMNSFGASAPAKDLYNYFGITAEHAAKKVHDVLTFYKNRPVPSLIIRP